MPGKNVIIWKSLWYDAWTECHNLEKVFDMMPGKNVIIWKQVGMMIPGNLESFFNDVWKKNLKIWKLHNIKNALEGWICINVEIVYIRPLCNFTLNRIDVSKCFREQLRKSQISATLQHVLWLVLKKNVLYWSCLLLPDLIKVPCYTLLTFCVLIHNNFL